jgi:hypothetical protein
MRALRHGPFEIASSLLTLAGRQSGPCGAGAGRRAWAGRERTSRTACDDVSFSCVFLPTWIWVLAAAVAEHLIAHSEALSCTCMWSVNADRRANALLQPCELQLAGEHEHVGDQCRALTERHATAFSTILYFNIYSTVPCCKHTGESSNMGRVWFAQNMKVPSSCG